MFYQQIRKEWKKPNRELRQRIRMEDTVERVDKPTRLDRARSLGYKAKQGFVIARVKIKKGKRHRPRPRKGRKPGNLGVFFTAAQSKQAISEKRAVRKYPNMEVLNSYYIGDTGTHKMYEVILIDPNHPSISKDPHYKWLSTNRRRAFRGKTSAGKKSRGL